MFSVSMPQKPAPHELDAVVLRQSMLRRVPKRLYAHGHLMLPAVPALLDHYVEKLGKLFALHGRPFNPDELLRLRDLLQVKLDEGYDQSRKAYVHVEFRTDEPPKTSLSYKFWVEAATLKDEYAHWVATRTPPLFGVHPDAKVMDLASSLGPPASAPVLDLGAGTGRNTLPLARAGFPAHAVELSPDLAQILRTDAQDQKLPVTLVEGDLQDGALELPKSHFRLVFLCEVVSDFRDEAALRGLFQRARELCVPGGLLLFNAFVPVGGYQPDRLARQLSEMHWSTLFLREELRAAADLHGFTLVSEESVYDFEKERLPASAWPPTGWFEEWTRGIDTFDLPKSRSPIEMRWFTWKKSGSE